MNETSPFMVFSGTNSRYLAERICASLNCPLGNMNITHFADVCSIIRRVYSRRHRIPGTVNFPQLRQPHGVAAYD